jgi:LmbE family N-acetylglucosaminyl deacetylase
MKKILVIAAHADDEVLGCGGTIARHCLEGDKVFIGILADGVTSRDILANKTERKSAAEKAATILGAQPPIFFDYPDNQMDTVPLLKIIKTIEGLIKEIRPDRIYTHFNGDLNIDHQIATRAVLTACRPVKDTSVKEILSFEVLSSTEWSFSKTEPFTPNFFVDITNTFDQKIEALKCYETEMCNFPHPRSLEAVGALNKLRGTTVGKDKAEGFVVLRMIN